MNDTSSDIYKKQLEIFLQKTDEERFKIADELSAFGREILMSSIRENNPGISKLDLHLEVFRKCYADNFTADEMDRILKSMRSFLLESHFQSR